ncbi:MAG TPA: potassium channel family protein [bacterium]|nr:potassium channel family protein [bacterium]
MRLIVSLAGICLIVSMLWDAFETVVLPRRVSRRVRVAFYIGYLWRAWVGIVGRIQRRSRREAYLAYFGPLVTLSLLAVWALGLILGFAMLHWGLGSQMSAPESHPGFGTDVYLSGTTFFTLGLGDVVPKSVPARIVLVVEGGVGFSFLALIISYLPVIYQAFSRRESRISVLDAWAGSPPSAGELLRRAGGDRALLEPFLREWEGWAAELLESHISYPVLVYFRSQHDNESWLSALTAILDTCALVIGAVEGAPRRVAELTFAMARHAVVDISIMFNQPPDPPRQDRLPEADRAALTAMLRVNGCKLRDDAEATARVDELRRMYEPYVNALSRRLAMPLPAWLGVQGARDNWQKSRWR